MEITPTPLPLLDNTRRMFFAQLTRGLLAGSALLALGAFTWRYALLRKAELGLGVDLSLVATSDVLTRVSVWGQLALLVPALVLLIRWQLRAYQNVHRLPGAVPQYSANMAGWGWFIPIAGFWLPYRVMGEIGRYIGGFTADAAGAVRSRWDVLLVLWWVLHIGEILFARVIWHTADADTLPELLSATRLQMVSQVVSLLADLALLALLRLLAPAERALLHPEPLDDSPRPVAVAAPADVAIGPTGA